MITYYFLFTLLHFPFYFLFKWIEWFHSVIIVKKQIKLQNKHAVIACINNNSL